MARPSRRAHDSVATLLQDVGADHGGTGVRVTGQGLDGANVRAPLQEMGGEAVPERNGTWQICLNQSPISRYQAESGRFA